MSYAFQRKPTAKMKFRTDVNSNDNTTLQGINSSLTSATTICDGINSLMAIGGNAPSYVNGERTGIDIVVDNGEE